MNISTELLHFDTQVAVCAVSLQAEDKNIRVYASALASETPLFADLAQQRALQLAFAVQEKGVEALSSGFAYLKSVHPARQNSLPPSAGEMSQSARQEQIRQKEETVQVETLQDESRLRPSSEPEEIRNYSASEDIWNDAPL